MPSTDCARRTVSTAFPGKALETWRFVESHPVPWSIPAPLITRMSQPTGALWMTVDNSTHTLCTKRLLMVAGLRRNVREACIHRIMHAGGHLCGSVWTRPSRVSTVHTSGSPAAVDLTARRTVARGRWCDNAPRSSSRSGPLWTIDGNEPGRASARRDASTASMSDAARARRRGCGRTGTEQPPLRARGASWAGGPGGLRACRASGSGGRTEELAGSTDRTEPPRHGRRCAWVDGPTATRLSPGAAA